MRQIVVLEALQKLDSRRAHALRGGAAAATAASLCFATRPRPSDALTRFPFPRLGKVLGRSPRSRAPRRV
jgi:hypothetical protein